jgi:DNA-binding helix-hairpin-helix protein with protein kinase domain
MDRVVLDGRTEVLLGATLARAGEGTIREVADRPEWVAKIFHPDLKDLEERRVKVAAMIGTPPPAAVQPDGFVVLTWPLHLIDGDLAATGYVMPRIDTADAVEIHAISNPSNRMNPAPGAPQWTRHTAWHHLVAVAANLCLAVQAVHQTKAVIADFQERNILVSNTARVTLVDCDSMQFTDAAGRQFLCGVGRPEFSAPELAEVSLRHQARDRASDLFALAVHIHLLLMNGNHPFLRGIWTGSGEQPNAMTLARNGDWAGGPGSRLHTHPLAPPQTFLPDAIQQLFVRAFTDGATDPHARPTATEWRSALLAVRVKQCPRRHDVAVESVVCPWCLIDDERVRRRNEREAAKPVPVQMISNIGPIRPTPPPVVATAAPLTAQPSVSSTQPWWRWKLSPRKSALAAAGALGLVALIAFGLASALSPAGQTTIRNMPVEVPIYPDPQSTGLPSVTYTCPGYNEGRYRYATTPSISMCDYAISVLQAANASPSISRGDAATIQVLMPRSNVAENVTCAREQASMVCRGGPTVVGLS